MLKGVAMKLFEEVLHVGRVVNQVGEDDVVKALWAGEG